MALLRYCWLILLHCAASAVAVAPPLVTHASSPPPPFPKRQIEENKAAVFGYSYGSDYTFTPSYCLYATQTLTTWSNYVGCCDSSGSSCRLSTGCSSGSVLVTQLGGTQTYFDAWYLDI
ncbi:hypothetical protein GQ43DRAFT_433471 [Delitschia confertaspora ATCC 74209]|uniref:Uncharacterized protein n=1 Tax=Delitschia confertaspora ATCC 74209 TaxID=1513339 RepID=A0A9P4MQW0_9PLEO|nr:hypothetical protein GQ43DRAFT_433471 [Delitschia confertaspora ATCC 74209]